MFITERSALQTVSPERPPPPGHAAWHASTVFMGGKNGRGCIPNAHLLSLNEEQTHTQPGQIISCRTTSAFLLLTEQSAVGGGSIKTVFYLRPL